LKEHGDKIAAADKQAIEDAIAAVRKAAEGDDAEAIKAKIEALAQASLKLGEAVYKANQAASGEDAGAAPNGAGDGKAAGESGVVDADFEEIDEERRDKSA
jgi:molecular chaperone DnaK